MTLYGVIQVESERKSPENPLKTTFSSFLWNSRRSPVWWAPSPLRARWQVLT